MGATSSAARTPSRLCANPAVRGNAIAVTRKGKQIRVVRSRKLPSWSAAMARLNPRGRLLKYAKPPLCSLISLRRQFQTSSFCFMLEINNSPAAQIDSLIFVYYLRTFHLLPSSQSTYKLGSLLMNVCPCNPLTR